MQYFKYRIFATAYCIVRNMATVKRFYRNTNILSSGEKFEITLDQRKLKTPQGKTFEVHSKPLALAVAAEWDAQKEVIDRGNMHLTALCNTVLDNPHKHTKLDMANYIVNCLEMDTLLFHSNETELYKLQAKKWDPLVQWFCDNYGVDIMKTKTIEAPTVSTETKAVLLRHLMSYNDSAVYGFMYGIDAIKSVILTLAAVERVLSIEEAVKLSLLEEGFQASYWGSVEWHHDHNKYDLQARLAAAILFVHLNSCSATSRPKNNNQNIS
ncbi:ATP synthase mitochondrial F1 complex assembly factor 2 homolog l(2)k14505 [Halictus rubicundus]|uniref:ATP synthase mitochondrial F1 complex assembly factor 2 homolog l(2)k14505 n=1 Tax=Halictus rubicundus TaxID=77578 RepID=UPI004036A346